MKIENTLLEDHQIQLTVEVEPELLETSKRKAARKIAQKVRIPGFRPGKAPYTVVQRQVGDAAILEDAIDVLLDDVYPKILEEAGVAPYGPGSLQNITSMDPPTFEFLIPLEPTVELGKYRDIRLEISANEVDPSDVDRALENLRERQAVLEPVTRGAQEGDLVYLTLEATRTDEEDPDKKQVLAPRKYPFLIEKADADTTEEWPYPGFSRNLIGLEAASEKGFEHTFGKDYEIEDLREVKVTYQVKVEEVKARNLPELDDAFAKSIGRHDTLAELIEEVKTSLQENLDQETNSEFENQMLEKIVAGATIKFPPQLLEHETGHMLEDLEQQLRQQGLEMDMYLKTREMDLAALKEELRPRAVERLERGLVLVEIAKAEEIQVPNETIEERLNETLGQIRQVFPEDEFRRFTAGEALQNLASRIASDELSRLTFERLRKIAAGESLEAATVTPENSDEAATADSIKEDEPQDQPN